jgi:hypothetical protein
MQIDADNLKFYLDDISRREMYSIVIPYEHKGIKKEFSIVFDFSWNRPSSEYPGDHSYNPTIYDLGISNQKIIIFAAFLGRINSL